MSGYEEIIKRYEAHFTKIFDAQDLFRTELRDYVKAPAFIISLITTALLFAGSAGWLLSIVFQDINKNETNIMQLAREQVRQETRQDSLEKNQEKTIAQLIKALKEK